MHEEERSEILTEMPEGTGEEELLGQGTVVAIREMRLRGRAKKAIARELGLANWGQGFGCRITQCNPLQSRSLPHPCSHHLARAIGNAQREREVSVTNYEDDEERHEEDDDRHRHATKSLGRPREGQAVGRYRELVKPGVRIR